MPSDLVTPVIVENSGISLLDLATTIVLSMLALPRLCLVPAAVVS
jgi:hypothetical protein